MSFEFIPPSAAIAPPAAAPVAEAPLPMVSSTTTAVTSPMSFGTLVADGMRQVDAQLQAAQVDLQRLAAGDAQNLHQVMVRLEEARLGFQLMLQVRNRLLESYQDVMRMQV